jgi:hypothetical protein
MESTRDQFFSRSVFAGDEHASVRWRNPIDALQNVADGLGRTNDLVPTANLASEKLDAFSEPPKFEDVPQSHEQSTRIQRLLDKIEGSLLGRLDGSIDRPVATDHDHTRVPIEFSHS